jgi:hypothetical protein
MGAAEVLEPELTEMVPATIRRQLARLRRRERGLRLLWGATRCLAVALPVLAGACLLDWWIDLRSDTPWTVRATMLVAQAVLWATLGVVFVIRPLCQRLSDSRLALWVESRAPTLSHRLISAVQLNQAHAATRGMSPALIAAVTREAEEQTAGMRFARFADHRRVNWCAGLAGPLLLAIASVLCVAPVTAFALLERQFLVDREVPRGVRLECVAPEILWPSGEDVVLRFRAIGDALGGDVPGGVQIDADRDPGTTYPLSREEQHDPGEAIFTARVPAPPADFTYHARLADGRTRQPGRVHFEARPAIVGLRAWVQLPRFCGLRPDGQPYEQEQPQGDVVGIAGSTVRVRFETQKPIRSATLELLGSDTTAVLPESVWRSVELPLLEDGRGAEGAFPLTAGTRGYCLVVEDKNGFRNAAPTRRSVRIAPEPPPYVALLPEHFPGSDDEGPSEDSEVEGVPVPLGATIRIGYTARAPYGLGRAQLRYRVNEGTWWPLPLTEVPATTRTGPFDPRRGAFAHSEPLDQVEFHAMPSSDPEQLPGRTEGGGRFDFQTRRIPNLKVGDRLELYVEAFDQNPDPERRPGRSESRVKAVVTAAELDAWVRQTLQEEARLRRLESRQRGVFASIGFPEKETPVRPDPTPAPVSVAAPFVRNWQLLGPFGSADKRSHDTAFPPESERTDLAREYDGPKGKVRWQLHESDTDHIDLERLFPHAAAAYAVCWAHSDHDTRALLVARSQGGIKVWLNRNLVQDGSPNRPVLIELPAGWSELLVKVDNGGGPMAFSFGLRDGHDGELLRGVGIQATTPPPAPPQFLHDWQLLGPFPNKDDHGHDAIYPPETEKTDLSTEFIGINGKIRWKAYRSARDKIDLERYFRHSQAGVAYAVCWVRGDARKVVLATGSDDGIKVWLNRKVVLDRKTHREAVPGEDTELVELAPGWNELLVKVDNKFGTWAFYLELRDPATGKRPEGLVVRATPPGDEERKFVRSWQAIGPFPNRGGMGRLAVYLPERERFNPNKEYDGLTGKVRWRPFTSDTDRINLDELLARPNDEANLAYAVSWVWSEKARPAVLAAGSSEGIRVWVNARQVLDRASHREATAGEDTEPIELAAGWNEVLVKVDHRSGKLAFYLELREPSTGRPLSGVEHRSTPPPDEAKR